jgi:hypothetical protein
VLETIGFISLALILNSLGDDFALKSGRRSTGLASH